MNESCWHYVIKFINEHEDGEILNATSMLHYVRKHKPEYKRKYYYTGIYDHVGVDALPDLVYSYRVILERLGFLKHIKKGSWIKVRSFPEHISSYKAKKIAFSKLPWQAWFIPPGWIVEGKTQKSKGG